MLTAEDAEFEQARKVWNGDIDHHPAVIAQGISAADLAEAILFAHVQGLELAARAGAHSMPGYTSVDGGLAVDLGRIR